MSDEAVSKRDLAIAEFFKAGTALLKECLPLVKDAVQEQLNTIKRRKALKPNERS